LIFRRHRFRAWQEEAAAWNRHLMESADPLELPSLEYLELVALVDWRTREGFQGSEGVSYLLCSDRGSLLFDVAFGPQRPALEHNTRLLGVDPETLDGLLISHLHLDHMGGLNAAKARRVALPESLRPSRRIPCALPAHAGAEGFEVRVVEAPTLLEAGLASTGPLERALFALGPTREQAVVARVAGKGLVVVTGCGHPTVQVLLGMVRRLSDEPVYGIAGGLHFPVTGGRGGLPGVELQAIFGTGKPPWQRITDDDLSAAIAAINEAGVERVLLSAHDTCDHALERMARELDAEVEVIEAGATYRF
jgi:7,8-dihydropterin-6-yl-methyl-4-(beta-D-ribofuranosyl)aminobenzene 5'-phosphate synthase